MKEISIYSLDWYITTERFFRIMNYNWYYIERYNCCKKKNAITCITSAVIQLKFFFIRIRFIYFYSLTKSKVHFVFLPGVFDFVIFLFHSQQMFLRYHGEFFAVIQDWTKRSAAETAEAYGSRLFGYDF